MQNNILYLKNKSVEIKKKAFEMVMTAGNGHLGGSFSCNEILVTLFYGGILNYDCNNPQWETRDRFILSKGHAHNTYYVILSDVGFFSPSELKNFGKNGSFLCGHVDNSVPGVEVIGGSLGHGMGIGAGIALALKRKFASKTNVPMVFVIIGDGECQEGSVWEAAAFASHHNLNNMVVFLDRNYLSSEDFTENTCALEPIDAKWKSFGWSTKNIDGHNFNEMLDSVRDCRNSNFNSPLIIICKTIKGKGMLDLENVPASHHTLPSFDLEKKIRENLKDG